MLAKPFFYKYLHCKTNQLTLVLEGTSVPEGFLGGAEGCLSTETLAWRVPRRALASLCHVRAERLAEANIALPSLSPRGLVCVLRSCFPSTTIIKVLYIYIYIHTVL